MTDIRELLEQGESATVEFKTSLADNKKIVETIAAMATVGGGLVLVGVRDDGRVLGLRLGEGDQERLVQRVLAHTDPKVYVDLELIDIDSRPVLCIRVPPGDGPHLASGRAYYRSGPATVAMSRDEYERRLLDRLRESSGFERRIDDGLRLTEIDESEVRRFAESARQRGPLPTGGSQDELELLRRLHLVRGDLTTVGGVLLFGRYPQGPFPQSTIRAKAVRGASVDAVAIEGSLFQQIDRAADFVARNLRIRPVLTELVRQDLPELPLSAVREVIANAVAHRDYRSTAPIQLRLDDRGLSVWNPGHFPPPITPALLRQDHPSVPTNPLVARVLYLAGYIEQWGTGTQRVIQAMRDQGNPEPLFEEAKESGIRVILPLPRGLTDRLSLRQQKLLGETKPGSEVRTAEYARQAGVAHRTALQDLRGLEDLGLVTRLGRGKACRWMIL
ncbi:MAG: hypothetical protein GY842_11110 [bacterium]|nr:hypothetical protein [bacterium]